MLLAGNTEKVLFESILKKYCFPSVFKNILLTAQPDKVFIMHNYA